ncbi:MAG: hypothetical protein ACJ72D_05235 [Marmoricola sp.]
MNLTPHRTPVRTVSALACAGVLAISLAGCGSSSTSDDKPATLSATDFKKQANALCKTANAEIATIQQELAAVTTEAEANTTITKLTGRIDTLVSAIKDLKEPSSLSSGVDAMLGEVTKVVDDINSQGIAYFQNLTGDPFEAADAKAREVGLPDCAGDS